MDKTYSKKQALEIIFDRPTEYIFMPKGIGNSYLFRVPNGYIKEPFRGISDVIIEKLTKKGAESIPVNNISLPDLTVAQQLGMKETFSLFLDKHLEIADYLIEIFMKQKTIDDLISAAAYAHDRVNPYLFNYALSVALLHREDTKDVQVPNFAQLFPAKFVPSAAFAEARMQAAVVPLGNRIPINLAVESTSNPSDPESRVAYFREDIGINLHHWHWHLVYPTRNTRPEIVNKDRRGELFYYMHEQVLARYNSERLANSLARVTNYSNLREVIPEGYFSKLDALVASRAWPPRFANTPLSDLNRPNDGLTLTLSEVELWMTRVREAINNQFILNASQTRVSLTGTDGIDIVANLVEASSLSLNRPFYGNIHNMGHMLIAFCHDPNNSFNERAGVIGDPSTSMRDPVFYRWHSYINSLFVMHKDKLPRYTVDQLGFKDVCVTDVQVSVHKRPHNQFITHWQQSDIDISRGLDFAPRSPVAFRFTHLQHEDFTYTIKVNNASTAQVVGTVRIYMGLKKKENGAPMKFDEQRALMIELDKFRVDLKPGDNTITRKSTESSVTIPYERTFRNLDENRPREILALYAFNFCGCGWPHHMLLPRGTAAGQSYDLFVMVSDNARDRIDQDVSGICNDAESYCGIQDKKYPDLQSMGFPFDRVGRTGVTNLASFLTPNMKVKTVTVKYENRTVIRGQTAAYPTVLSPTN